MTAKKEVKIREIMTDQKIQFVSLCLCFRPLWFSGSFERVILTSEPSIKSSFGSTERLSWCSKCPVPSLNAACIGMMNSPKNLGLPNIKEESLFSVFLLGFIIPEHGKFSRRGSKIFAPAAQIFEICKLPKVEKKNPKIDVDSSKTTAFFRDFCTKTANLCSSRSFISFLCPSWLHFWQPRSLKSGSAIIRGRYRSQKHDWIQEKIGKY